MDAQGTISIPDEVAEKFGTYFHESFSNKNYKQDFINKIKTPTEKLPIISTISSNNSEKIDLNSNITLDEMENAIKKYKSKSPGPDSIPYSFITNLGEVAKKYLLYVYNNIWHYGIIPKEWKKGIIIPILNNKHFTEGYRIT
jgi:hypothetical protein